MAENTETRVAIVGGGACGVAILLQLLEKGTSGMSIVMLEKNSDVGTGLAYSNACVGTRVNMHANTMSLYAKDPNHFSRWLKDHPPPPGLEEFPPREHYGQYLRDTLLRSVQLAKQKGITLVIRQAEVVDVVRSAERKWLVHLADGATLSATDVALAFGNYMSQVCKHLEGIPLYFGNPWPNSQLHDIPKHASVAILGSRLTAIDEALYLTDRGYTGQIYLISRTGQLPKVQGTARKYDRAYALHNLARELEQASLGSIITIARRLHDEMHTSSHGRNLGRIDTTRPDCVLSQFKFDIELARKGEVPGQVVLRETAPIIERYWKCLDDTSKHVFLREYMSTWVIHRHAMPLKTAVRLLRVLESGQLQVLKINTKKPITHDGKRFAIATLCPDQLIYTDALIESTGLESDATKVHTPLMRNLLARKALTPLAAGGVKCDFHTLQVRPGLYVIGSMTRGVHFYSTAIDRNVVHAERLADSILKLPTRKPLHIALFVGKDIYSQLAASQLVQHIIIMGSVPFIFQSTDSYHKPSDRTFEESEMEFYNTELLQNIVVPHLGSDISNVGVCLTIPQLRARYGILAQHVCDINDAEFHRLLSANHIDVGFDIAFPQALESKTIQFFHHVSRRGLFSLRSGTPSADSSVLAMLKSMSSGNYNFVWNLNELTPEDTKSNSHLVSTRSKEYNPTKAALNAIDDVWRTSVSMVLAQVEDLARGFTPARLSQSHVPTGSNSSFGSSASSGDSTRVSVEGESLAAYYASGLRLVNTWGMRAILVKSYAPQGNSKGLEDVIERACKLWYRRSRDQALREVDSKNSASVVVEVEQLPAQEAVSPQSTGRGSWRWRESAWLMAISRLRVKNKRVPRGDAKTVVC